MYNVNFSLVLFTITWITTSSVIIPSVQACSFFGNKSIDFADTNLSVVVIKSTHPLSSCCDACDAWNAHKKPADSICSFGVELETYNETVCALKSSSLKPFAATHATAVASSGPSAMDNMDLIILPNDTSVAYGAVCLDGSPPAVYMSQAITTADPSAANKWVLYFKGGGWCYDEFSCAQRTQTLIGSSNQLQAKQPKFGYGGSGPLGDSAVTNPSFANFNHVMFWYCDGGSFTGDRDDVVQTGNNQSLFFRGKRNLDAMLRYLRRDQNLGNATEILLSGGSAGGLSAYLHADYIRSTFAPSVKFRASPVSGFFLDHDTFDGVAQYPTQMKGLFAMMNSSGGVNQECVKALSVVADEWRCIFANASYAYTSTPIFPLNSAVDAWQMGNIFDAPAACVEGANPQFANCSSVELSKLIEYERDFLRDITTTATFVRPGNGGFIESCHEHCAAQGRSWNTIVQQGVTMQQALTTWWDAPDGANAQDHWHLPCTLNSKAPGQCNPSCAT